MPYRDPKKENDKSRRWRKAHPDRAREVTREASRRWRARNPELARQRTNESRARRVAKLKKLVDEAKASGCRNCGSFDLLEFHHRDATQKSFTIGSSLSVCNRKQLEAELAKCDVLCRSCHRTTHR